MEILWINDLVILHEKKYGWESEQYLKCYTSEELFYDLKWPCLLTYPNAIRLIHDLICLYWYTCTLKKIVPSCPGLEVCIERQIDLYSNICTTPISKSTVLISKLNLHIFKRIVDRFNSIIPIFLFFKIGKIDLRIGLNAMVELI